MDIKIKTKNLSLTDRVQDMVDDKLGRLEKFLPEDADATVTLKGKKNYVKVEMTIPMKRYTLRVEEEDRDLHNAIDKVQSVMERQIRKYKTRLTNKKRKGESHEVIEAPIEMIEQMEEDDFKAGAIEGEEKIEIVRNKRFVISPMSAQEACLQMDMLGHGFFVFAEEESGEICVVYRRTDGAYGLIETAR